MGIKIFVNLPVKNLDASKAFFGKLGFSFNPQFTDETAACMVLSEENYVMLLTHAKFAEFTTKPVADATKATEVLIAISQDSRADVDRMVDKAVKAGGVEPRAAADYGFMFQRAFEDLDGHIWEVIWMDPSAVEPQN
jgi:predicted lactoylglutathione lyase